MVYLSTPTSLLCCYMLMIWLHPGNPTNEWHPQCPVLNSPAQLLDSRLWLPLWSQSISYLVFLFSCCIMHILFTDVFSQSSNIFSFQDLMISNFSYLFTYPITWKTLKDFKSTVMWCKICPLITTVKTLSSKAQTLEGSDPWCQTCALLVWGQCQRRFKSCNFIKSEYNYLSS